MLVAFRIVEGMALVYCLPIANAQRYEQYYFMH